MKPKVSKVLPNGFVSRSFPATIGNAPTEDDDDKGSSTDEDTNGNANTNANAAVKDKNGSKNRLLQGGNVPYTFDFVSAGFSSVSYLLKSCNISDNLVSDDQALMVLDAMVDDGVRHFQCSTMLFDNTGLTRLHKHSPSAILLVGFATSNSFLCRSI